MTLDDRLDVIAERSFIVNCHSEYDKDATKSDKDYYKVKLAILSDLEKIIEENFFYGDEQQNKTELLIEMRKYCE